MVRVQTLLLALLCLLPAKLWAQPGMTATYVHHTLQITVPYAGLHAGSGRLAVELLSPEDQVLAHVERSVEAAGGGGMWTAELAPEQAMPLDDLVWQRVRYRFRFAGEGSDAAEQVRSVSAILRRPVVHLLGQREFLAESPAALRLVVTDGTPAATPLAHGTVRIELKQGSGAQALFTGKLDQHGSVNAEFRFPPNVTGDASLHIVAETPLGSAETTESIHLDDKVSVLLTTEKPIYQPSQTIHVRALALERADHHAAGGRRLTFEIEDARGNKVFRKETTTDSFGVASAEVPLADEVNLGAWHLHALLAIGKEAAGPATDTGLTVQVERYVLPKFRVSIKFAEKDGKPQRDFRPGDHVTGTVEAGYFFGKPVANAAISLQANLMDAGPVQGTKVEGRTDGAGRFAFDLPLPAYVAGRSGAGRGGSAPAVIEASVKDTAGHTESRGEPVTITAQSLLIQAIPEGGSLVTGLDNLVYVLTSYPDGTPAETTVRVHSSGNNLPTLQTEVNGVGTLHVQGSAANQQLHLEADDHHGRRASMSVPLMLRDGDDQVLLRTDHAVYRAGETVRLDVFSTSPQGTVYVDVLKDGQTMLTRDVDLSAGRAGLAIPVTPALAGTVEIDAYLFGADSRVVSDHRLLFVQPAEDLHIEAHADRASYLPGAEARVDFRVTDGHGKGVEAALGLEIVDEAVFALAEKQPGFAKVFFYLEQELLKPRFEIHSVSPEQFVAEPVAGHAEQESMSRDMAARLLFSAAASVDPHPLDTTFGGNLPQGSRDRFALRYQDVMSDAAVAIARQLRDRTASGQTRSSGGLRVAFASLGEPRRETPRDAWGTPMRLEHLAWDRQNRLFRLSSAGPDRAFGTDDDMSVTIDVREGTTYVAPGSGSIALRVEGGLGPLNALAQVNGAVLGATGAVVPGARVALEPLDGGRARHATSDGRGTFALAGVPAGRYQVSVAAPGFMTTGRTFTLTARDAATLICKLQTGMQTEMVEVFAGRAVMNDEAAMPVGRAGAMAQMRFAAAAPMMAKAPPAPPPAAGLVQTEAHTRSYFPEALFIAPEIITDAHGSASVSIPMADSVTTWHMAMFASTRSGALGTGTSSLKVFQDFFVDLDLPVTITEGDRISVPVAVYNYSGKPGAVELRLAQEDWFAMPGDAAEKTVQVAPDSVGASQFTVEARHIGTFKLTLTAHMGDRQDTVVREIEVVPNGQPREAVFNGRLDSGAGIARQQVRYAAGAIPEASKLFVRLYPGPLSEIAEGMDGVLRMPYGCFEQTSSSTYPNVLALDYMKRTRKLTPEIHAKAEGFIATGYQRLLTFEVPGGGFSWFGQAPANKILTAYGLMEFKDMSAVHQVDPRVIERTRDWLIEQQQPDGSWKPDTNFINEGATNRFNTDAVRITAYIAWSLANTGYTGPALDRASSFLHNHVSSSAGKLDAYTLAVLANFAVDSKADPAWTREVLGRLLDSAQHDGTQMWWTSEETGLYGAGTSGAVETTGLAVQALLKAGEDTEAARKALAWLLAHKSGDGNWGSTQATIMALRALVMASEHSGGDALGAVAIVLNGKSVRTLQLTAGNNDLFQQVALPAGVAADDVELRFQGSGTVAYQIDGRSFVPWEATQTATQGKPPALSIAVAYDRTKLAGSDMVNATATVHSNLRDRANMVMVDLGIPPGFELQTEDLQTMVERTAHARTGRLEKFNLTATQAILYFDSVGAGETLTVPFRLRAKYPMRAKNFASRVYEYYDPSVGSTAGPAAFEVTGR